METHNKGLLIFAGLILLSFMIGSSIMSVCFFGGLLLLGLILLIENVPPLKWIAKRSTQAIDIALFVFSAFAMLHYGYNIAGAMTVAGIGYTLYYGPKLRYERQANRGKKKQVNHRSRFNMK